MGRNKIKNKREKISITLSPIILGIIKDKYENKSKYFENLAYNDLVKNGDLPNGSL